MIFSWFRKWTKCKVCHKRPHDGAVCIKMNKIFLESWLNVWNCALNRLKHPSIMIIKTIIMTIGSSVCVHRLMLSSSQTSSSRGSVITAQEAPSTAFSPSDMMWPGTAMLVNYRCTHSSRKTSLINSHTHQKTVWRWSLFPPGVWRTFCPVLRSLQPLAAS